MHITRLRYAEGGFKQIDFHAVDPQASVLRTAEGTDIGNGDRCIRIDYELAQVHSGVKGAGIEVERFIHGNPIAGPGDMHAFISRVFPEPDTVESDQVVRLNHEALTPIKASHSGSSHPESGGFHAEGGNGG
jgi:hypothetical protein